MVFFELLLTCPRLNDIRDYDSCNNPARKENEGLCYACRKHSKHVQREAHAEYYHKGLVKAFILALFLPFPPIRRHHLRDWSLFEYSKSGTSAANVIASWHNEDPTDYLAGAYWMRLDGNLATDSVTNAEVGIFIDGPEFSNPSPQLPTEGTDVYRGHVAGMYTYLYGPTWQHLDPRLLDGLKETGEFSGMIALKVDFANAIIEGCVACVENFETTGVTVDTSGNRGELYTNLSLAPLETDLELLASSREPSERNGLIRTGAEAYSSVISSPPR